MANGKDYKGFSRLVSLILVIIPITSWIMGIFTRFKDGHIVAAIIRIFAGWNIIWIADIVLMVLEGRILRLLKV